MIHYISNPSPPKGTPMPIYLKLILIASLGVLTTGCGGGGSAEESVVYNGTDPLNPDSYPVTKITATSPLHTAEIGEGTKGTFEVTLGNTKKDVYLLLSNNGNFSDSQSSISSSAKRIQALSKIVHKDTSDTKATENFHAKSLSSFYQAMPQHLAHASQNGKMEKQLTATIHRNQKAIGDSEVLYTNEDTSTKTIATLRHIVSNVSTKYGKKTLLVYVSNDSFGAGCDKRKCVTQSMVDALADNFLKAGEDNDIYDWGTSVFGEEWGDDARASYANLIGASDEITLLLTDIDNDNDETRGVIGYFHPKDNFSKATYSGSNERIMFYIDAVMFANEENEDNAVWDIEDPMPMEMLSTLAHEFQHMIHFYQKTISLVPDARQTKTWINEMLSEATEDLVATKLHHQGPRGVAYTDGSAGETNNHQGRYWLFNQNNDLSLTSWSNTLKDYAKVSAFGAFLTRNYGGAKLLHDIAHNAYTDEQAILDAVHKAPNGAGKSLNTLIHEWGAAVLLSDIESPEDQPTYNTGDFTLSTYNGITYELGSINFFNYDPAPNISTVIGTVNEEGNYYYEVGTELTGKITLKLDLSTNTNATLIVKEHR